MLRFCTALLAVLCGLAAPQASALGLSVKVEIEGLEGNLRKELRPVSSLARKPGSYSALAPIRRAANGDAQALLEALQSKGYYAASVEPSLSRTDDDVTVTLTVRKGQRFTITGYQLIYLDEQKTERPDSLYALGVAAGSDPSGAALDEVENKLIGQLWNRGYLGAEVVRREVRADFTTSSAAAVFRLKTGAKARYGVIEVEGLERTDPHYIRQMRTFERGAIAQREEIDLYRDELIETGLFNEIDVQPQLPAEDGTTDILVRAEERKHRTLGGGVSFATDIGPTVNAFWENRNLFRRGESLRASAVLSAPLQELAIGFRKPRPAFPGYYTLSSVLRNEDTDAFNAQTFELGGSVAKIWMKRRLTTELGLRYQYSNITEDICRFSDGSRLDRDDGADCAALGATPETSEEAFQAVSTPITILWNSQRQPLDPQDGWLAGFLVTPFVGTTNFARIEASYTDRIFWGKDDGGTFAGRIKLGAIYGAERSDIPATERFYAGGGGSLRGYAFQEASPIEPGSARILGGASAAEFNFELRQHVTEKIELAAFTDIGGAFEANTPDFENVLVGAGVGVRYHTPIGPIRVDLAVPLDRRRIFGPDQNMDGAPDLIFEDTAFEFYIGLGQPF